MLINFHLQKDYILFLLCIISSFLLELLMKLKVLEIDNSNANIAQFYKSLGQFFLIILFFVENKILDSSVLHEKSFENEIQLKNISKQSIKFIIISIILDYISLICYNKALNMKDFKLMSLEMYLQFTCFFLIEKKIISKSNMYSHHYLSFFLNIITMIVLFISLNEFNSLNSYFMIVYILYNSYCYAFTNLFIKYINKFYFMNIYFLASIFGIFECIFQIIVGREKFLPFNAWCIPIMILSFFNFFLFFYLTEKFNPIIVNLSKNTGEYLFRWFWFAEKTFKFFTLMLIVIILNIIIYMIYLEIMALNFLGLNKNFTREIEERAERETKNLINDSVVRGISDCGVE